MKTAAEILREYKGAPTWAVYPALGIELLAEVWVPWCGDSRPAIVWRWRGEGAPRMSYIRDTADDDAAFKVNRQWVRLSKCAAAGKKQKASRKARKEAP